MNTAIKRRGRLQTWRAVEKRLEEAYTAETAFSRDRAMVDELGLDKEFAEWRSVASIGTFWQRYQNQLGQSFPFYDNEAEWFSVLARCRAIGEVFPQALGVLENLVNYTVGTGYKFQVQPKERGQEKWLVKQCQDIIDEALDRTQFACDLDRELFTSWRKDGDLFIAIYDLGDGFADVRQVAPEYVTQPSDEREIEDWLGDSRPSNWTFGVRTAFGDTQTVYGYYVQWSDNPGDFDYFEASDIVHAKLNARRATKRGLSDFHCPLVWLHRGNKLMRNTSIGATIQSSIAYVEEYAETVTKAQAEDVAIGTSAYTYQDDGDKTRYAQQTEAGQVLGLGPGVKFVPGPTSSEKNGNFLQVASAITRLIGCRWSMPEYLISGDASNANYASTMVAESPWVKATEARQAQYGNVQVRVLWRILEIALQAGRIRSMHAANLDELKRYVKIMHTAPQAAVRDRGIETTRYATMNDKGVLSDQTWCEREGFDWEEEQERGASADPPPMIDPLSGGSAEDGSSVGDDKQTDVPTPEQIARQIWKGYP